MFEQDIYEKVVTAKIFWVSIVERWQHQYRSRNNAMLTILITLAFITTFGTQARAETKLDASNFTVSVNLTDGATGACWTKTGEVRQYIEGKLQEIGFKLGHFNSADALMNQYVFDVSVFAKRKTFGDVTFCDGGVQTAFKTNTQVNGQEHTAQLAGYSINGSNPDWDATAMSLVGLVIQEIKNYFQ